MPWSEWTWWMWVMPFTLFFPFVVAAWCTEDLILRFANVPGRIPLSHDRVLKSFTFISGEGWHRRAIAIGVATLFARLMYSSSNYLAASNSWNLTCTWMWTIFAIFIGLKYRRQLPEKELNSLDEQTGPWSFFIFVLLLTFVANAQSYLFYQAGIADENRFIAQQLAKQPGAESLLWPISFRVAAVEGQQFSLVERSGDGMHVYVICPGVDKIGLGVKWSDAFNSSPQIPPWRHYLARIKWSTEPPSTLSSFTLAGIQRTAAGRPLRWVRELETPFPN